jgi:hypothetical protein
MTYKEKLEKLYDVFAMVSQKYLENQKELSEVNGFFDGKLIENGVKLEKEYKDAENELHNFEAFIRKNGINLDSEIGE